MSVKEQQQKIVEIISRWQKLEDTAVAQTARIMEATDHPLIRLVAEIIQRDSNMHHRIQQMVIDTLQTETVALNFDQLREAWDEIEKHIQIEKKTVQMAQEALELLPPRTNQIQQYLVAYLLEDEKKHDKMLDELSRLKKGVYT